MTTVDDFAQGMLREYRAFAGQCATIAAAPGAEETAAELYSMEELPMIAARLGAFRARAEAAEQRAELYGRFVQECGFLADIEVYSPDDLPAISERLVAFRTRAEAAEVALAQAHADRTLLAGLWLATVPPDVLPTLLPADPGDRDRLAAALDAVDLQASAGSHTAAVREVIGRIVRVVAEMAGGAR